MQHEPSQFQVLNLIKFVVGIVCSLAVMIIAGNNDKFQLVGFLVGFAFMILMAMVFLFEMNRSPRHRSFSINGVIVCVGLLILHLIMYAEYFEYFYGGIAGLICILIVIAALIGAILSPFLLLSASYYYVTGTHLQRHLAAKGYDWITTKDAVKIYRAIGTRAYRLPEHDALGVLPGYLEGNIHSLIYFAQFLPQRRRFGSPI